MDYFSDSFYAKFGEDDELIKHLSFEEKKEVIKEVIEEQRRLVLHEPWTIARWDIEARNKFLQQYTPEEQELMAVRCELEHQRCKETGKELGN